MEYIDFLLPHNGVERLFFFIIFGMAILVAFWQGIVATEQNWEKNWDSNTPDDDSDDLHAEHGSVFELSEAISTPAEKLAEELPGICLIIGLFGTFLGLGVALQNASDIISSSKSIVNGNVDVQQMNKTMSDMMQQLTGLGAMFKSSIYGILCYLGFSFWQKFVKIEKKRLLFCIKKVNEETTTDEIHIALEGLTDAVSKLHGALESGISTNMVAAIDSGMLTINKNLEQNVSEMNSIAKKIEQSASQMGESFVSTANFTRKLKEISDNAKESFDSVAQSCIELNAEQKKYSKSVCNTQDNVVNSCKLLVDSVNSMNETMQEKFASFMGVIGNLSDCLVEADKKRASGFDKLSQDVFDGLKNVSAQFENTYNEFKQMHDDSNKSNEKANAALADTLGKSEKSLQQASEQFLELGKTLTSMNELLKGNNINSQKQQSMFDEIQKQMTGIVEQLENIKREFSSAPNHTENDFQTVSKTPLISEPKVLTQEDTRKALEKELKQQKIKLSDAIKGNASIDESLKIRVRIADLKKRAGID